jgi:hypothetical protein
MNITYIEKDKVLRCLCTDELMPENHYSINQEAFLKETGLDTEVVDSILTYFSRIGLVSEVNYRYHASEFYLIVHTEAFDLYNHGGFAVQEELLIKNIEKLMLEVEKLQSQFPEKVAVFANLATIAGIILGGATKFFTNHP